MAREAEAWWQQSHGNSIPLCQRLAIRRGPPARRTKGVRSLFSAAAALGGGVYCKVPGGQPNLPSMTHHRRACLAAPICEGLPAPTPYVAD